jgi:unsaturated chondroitin disaccharide hydrolase
MNDRAVTSGDPLALYETARQRMIERLRRTLAEPLAGFPDHADIATGRWITKADGDCTGGFFVGLLWLAARENPELLAIAQHWAEALRPRVRSRTHYRGMLFYQGTVLGDLLFGGRAARDLSCPSPLRA